MNKLYRQHVSSIKNDDWNKYAKSFNFFLLIFLFVLSSCQNTSSNKILEKETKIKLPIYPVIQVQVLDTNQSDTVKHIQPKRPLKKVTIEEEEMKEKQVFEEPEYFENESDDPNYIGTPCLLVDGVCIRHKNCISQPSNSNDNLDALDDL